MFIVAFEGLFKPVHKVVAKPKIEHRIFVFFIFLQQELKNFGSFFVPFNFFERHCFVKQGFIAAGFNRQSFLKAFEGFVDSVGIVEGNAEIDVNLAFVWIEAHGTLVAVNCLVVPVHII